MCNVVLQASLDDYIAVGNPPLAGLHEMGLTHTACSTPKAGTMRHRGGIR